MSVWAGFGWLYTIKNYKHYNYTMFRLNTCECIVVHIYVNVLLFNIYFCKLYFSVISFLHVLIDLYFILKCIYKSNLFKKTYVSAFTCTILHVWHVSYIICFIVEGSLKVTNLLLHIYHNTFNFFFQDYKVFIYTMNIYGLRQLTTLFSKLTTKSHICVCFFFKFLF